MVYPKDNRQAGSWSLTSNHNQDKKGMKRRRDGLHCFDRTIGTERPRDLRKKKNFTSICLRTPHACGKYSCTYMHHVDQMVGQPEEAESHHDGQDEFLAPDASAEFCLSDAA